MSQHLKALVRLQAKPPLSDFKWTELKTLLEQLGFEMLTNKGSRRKFFHRATGALIICHAPHPSPNVDKGCIVDVVQTLKNYNLI